MVTLRLSFKDIAFSYCHFFSHVLLYVFFIFEQGSQHSNLPSAGGVSDNHTVSGLPAGFPFLFLSFFI